ncbi:hypothetical protein HFP89_04935 [Wenzhouxiangella sp. XN79A]|uniref:DUF6502 family protein n=1 Tax=Wenzhouxiangella sp. XN79A TaxID=2724193 RepID=UPI00144A5170|nr:DUF6502 family protein [Wenzhouxiangella sp. XN79A]NKI34508.1 hypothetical protein [Wenzhouxiangella sp. XN79A]
MHAHDLSHENEVAGQLAEVIERLLRPLIRLFVGRVSCDFMVRMLKRLYIEEAKTWIEKHDGSRVTKSKLALLTGLDARTIASIEERVSIDEDIQSRTVFAEACVLYHWTENPDYQDEHGAPAVLQILGRPRTFQTLVSPLVGRSVTAKTVLQRLIDSGNVEIVDETHVRLLDPHYQPVQRSEATVLNSGSWSLSRLFETIENNLNADDRDDRLLQQDRYSISIPIQDVPAVRAALREVLLRHIKEVESLLEDHESDRETGTTLGVGWFVFQQPQPSGEIA